MSYWCSIKNVLLFYFKKGSKRGSNSILFFFQFCFCCWMDCVESFR